MFWFFTFKMDMRREIMQCLNKSTHRRIPSPNQKIFLFASNWVIGTCITQYLIFWFLCWPYVKDKVTQAWLHTLVFATAASPSCIFTLQVQPQRFYILLCASWFILHWKSEWSKENILHFINFVGAHRTTAMNSSPLFTKYICYAKYNFLSF